jgi:hypothetical protein
MKRPPEQISVIVANTQMRHLRVEEGKGFTRTVKGSDSVGPKGIARSDKDGINPSDFPPYPEG